MTQDDFADFSKGLVAVADVFDAELPESKLLMYFRALSDLRAADVLRALEQSIRELRFFPKPSELRDFALGDVEADIEEAWLTWKHFARKVGAYADVEWHDPVLLETIMAVFGSWPAACRADFSDEMWAAKRKEFGRVYHALARRGTCSTTKLLGVCATENLQRFGIEHPRTRLEAGEPKQLTSGDEAEHGH